MSDREINRLTFARLNRFNLENDQGISLWIYSMYLLALPFLYVIV